MSTVESFARALERDDFGALRAALSASCTWGDARGTEAVVAARMRESERLKRWFDEVRREVRVEVLDAARAATIVTDYLMKVPGRWHRRRIRLDVELGADGTVDRVIECEAPEEAQAFGRFLAECGIAGD